MNVKVDTNVKAVAKELRRLGMQGRRLLARAMYEEGERIMTVSKAKYVPVDLGVLRSSGHVAPPFIGPEKVLVVLGFGGAAAPYAEIVHERLLSKNGNPINHPVGQAKYLETPTMEAVPGMANRVRARVVIDLRDMAAESLRRTERK